MKALSINQPWAWCIVWRKVNKPYNAPTTDKIYTGQRVIRGDKAA